MIPNKKINHWANIKKNKKKHSKKYFSKMLSLLLSLVFLFVFIYSFIFSDFLVINDISVNGSDETLSKKIKNTINEDISGEYFNFISKNNILLFNKRNKEQDLKNEFKEIEQIKIKKQFPNKLKVSVVERNNILIVCSNGDCFFINQKGVAYSRVDSNLNNVGRNKVIRLIDESKQSIKKGDKILSANFVFFLTNISKVFNDYLGIKLRDDYRTNSCVSEEIIAQTKNGWDILLSAKIPPEKSAQTLKVVLDKQITLKEFNQLEYIDLRLENKAFYRLKGAAVEEEKKIANEENNDFEKKE